MSACTCLCVSSIVCVCITVCLCVCVQVYMCVCLCPSVYVCICVSKCLCLISLCVQSFLSVSLCAHVFVCVSLCVRVSIRSGQAACSWQVCGGRCWVSEAEALSPEAEAAPAQSLLHRACWAKRLHRGSEGPSRPIPGPVLALEGQALPLGQVLPLGGSAGVRSCEVSR